MKTLLFLLFASAAVLPATAHPDPAHSLAELDRHLAETPDDAMLHLRRAELLLRRNHPETARPSVVRALALSPDNPEIVLVSVRLAHAEGRLPQALAKAQEATRRFPEFPPAWKWLARLRKESGDANGAIDAKLRHVSFKDAVDPGDFLTAAAWVRERNDEGDPLLALSVLDQAVGVFGPIVALQQAAIPLEISLSRHEQALARVAALVRKYGPSASSSLLRADIHEAAGRHAEAAAACDSAIAMLDASAVKGDDPLAAIRGKILLRKEENLRKAR
ncbi:tetratricopeptide repeat protein [Luteolibacter sp. SL250]|uniref:tetratricopeptide repeat protein n=1 Tax=Luteolibacter sp. SL250 TaxID=2995170 RepID=UPI00226FFD3F|nr:tetratricopeptide repeat protein [Luteolibacter sp. SL250]WAC19167.1 tetratricopeptide repeat protein [Luteolibacter sp. SL250]